MQVGFYTPKGPSEHFTRGFGVWLSSLYFPKGPKYLKGRM